MGGGRLGWLLLMFVTRPWTCETLTCYKLIGRWVTTSWLIPYECNFQDTEIQASNPSCNCCRMWLLGSDTLISPHSLIKSNFPSWCSFRLQIHESSLGRGNVEAGKEICFWTCLCDWQVSPPIILTSLPLKLCLLWANLDFPLAVAAAKVSAKGKIEPSKHFFINLRFDIARLPCFFRQSGRNTSRTWSPGGGGGGGGWPPMARLFEFGVRLRGRFSSGTREIKSSSLPMPPGPCADTIRLTCHSIICSLGALALTMQLHRMDVKEDLGDCDVGLATGGALNSGPLNGSHMSWQCLRFHTVDNTRILSLGGGGRERFWGDSKGNDSACSFFHLFS